MGFNKRRIKEYDIVRKEYFNKGHEAFVELYSNTDCFIGSTKSIDFILDRLKGKIYTLPLWERLTIYLKNLIQQLRADSENS